MLYLILALQGLLWPRDYFRNKKDQTKGPPTPVACFHHPGKRLRTRMQIVMLPQNSLLVPRNLQLCNLPILPPLHHISFSHLISYCADSSLEPLPNFDPSPNLVPQFSYTILVLQTPELHTSQMPHEFIVAGDTLLSSVLFF